MKTEQKRPVSLTIEGAVAQIILSEPQSRNALSDNMRAGLRDAVFELSQQKDLGALILTGSDGAFCAGGDLKALHAQHSSKHAPLAEDLLKRMKDLHGWLRQLRDISLPVIVAVDGPAFGAGLGLALTGDIILASTRAQFCAPFCKVGVVPDGNLFYSLPRMVGLQRARELFYSGRVVDAEEAQRIGLCMEVLPPENLLDRARDIAEMMCDSSPTAFSLTKSITARSFDLDSEALLQLEAQAQAICLSSDYHKDAVDRFVNKEPLRFAFR